MRATARDQMDRMVQLLKYAQCIYATRMKNSCSRRSSLQMLLGPRRNMPRSLVLVLRNLNLVRSINAELGAPVNRYGGGRDVSCCAVKATLR